MTKDLTQGPPWRLLVSFGLPLFVGNVFQQAYNLVDTMIVGKFVGPVALAGVGVASPVFNLINALLIGLSVGSSIMVSQLYGARREKELPVAMSTILAVFENIMACWMDLTGMSRRKVAAINLVLMLALSLPCVLGFNLWSGFQPFGDGSTIMDLEDFLVSNIWLPIGSLIYLLFCTSRYGWGWKNFTQEANTGKGLKVGNWMRWYVTYLLPIVILAIFLIGINDKFHITQALFGH